MQAEPRPVEMRQPRSGTATANRLWLRRFVRCVGTPFQTPDEGQNIIAETKHHGTITGRYHLHRWKYDDRHWRERKQVIRDQDAIPWRQVLVWRKAPNIRS